LGDTKQRKERQEIGKYYKKTEGKHNTISIKKNKTEEKTHTTTTKKALVNTSSLLRKRVSSPTLGLSFAVDIVSGGAVLTL
jgi:hypothetical protein